MIARYTVMENLSYQSPAMTLRVDYKVALLQLYRKLLQWFASTFKLAEAIRDDSSDFSTQSELIGTTWEEIKEIDQARQRFTVVVEAKEESSDSEENSVQTPPESEADIEDVSNESIDDDVWGFKRFKKEEQDRKYEPESHGRRGDGMTWLIRRCWG